MGKSLQAIFYSKDRLGVVLAASLLAWKVHSWCVFICEQQKWENVPVAGGSQYMNPFFFN